MHTDRQRVRPGLRPTPVLARCAAVALLLASLASCSAAGDRTTADPIAAGELPAKCQAAIATTAPTTEPPDVTTSVAFAPSSVAADRDGAGSATPARARMRGRVIDGLCRTPVAGAGVFFFTDQDRFAPAESTETGADGRFDIELPRERYRIAFNNAGLNYDFTWYPDAADHDGSEEVPLRGDTDLGDLEMFHPEDQPVPEYQGEGPRRIVVIGDSLVQQSTTAIARKLDLIGPVSVRGIANQRIDQMQPVADRYASMDPETVVIALGSNDVNQGHPDRASIAALDYMVSTFAAARCVLVLDLNTQTPRREFNEPGDELNEGIERVVARHPNAHLVRWNVAVAVLLTYGPATRWFTDGLHLTTDGIDGYARTITDAVAAC